MLKGREMPSHDETNPPTSPHQRALAPLSLSSFSMNSPRSFRHFPDDVKVLEDLYTNGQIDFYHSLVVLLNNTSNRSTMLWTKPFLSVVLLLPWTIFFHCTRIQLDPCLCPLPPVLCICLSTESPRGLLPLDISFSMPSPGSQQWC